MTSKNSDESTDFIPKPAQPPKKMAKPSKLKVGLLFTFATVFIVAGIVAGLYWSPIYDNILSKALILSPTSKSFSIWKETPIPMYIKIYLFHWTNPELLGKAKPHFIEKGPYVFKEVDYKVNRHWNANNTITFQQKRVWHYLESESYGSLDDEIVNLNPVALTIAYKVRHMNRFVRMALSGTLEALNEHLTVKKKVRELLFEGYDDRLIDFAEDVKVPVPWDKFGWFYARNGSESYDGTFTMDTGAGNEEELGILREWNYHNMSTIYPGQCGLINGTLGDLWPPVKEFPHANVFAPDICTLLQLHDNGTVDYDGLAGKKFISTAKTFDNGTLVESRACYCQDVECQPSGTLNVSTCKFGAPAFVSLPHFYLADKSYIDAVDGLKPAEDDSHEFSILVEPDLGIPLQVRARLQLNLLLQPIEHISIYEKVPKIFIPMLWFRQEADLTSNLSLQIKFLLILPTLGHVTFYGIAGIGILLFFIGGVICIRGRRKTDDNQQLIGKRDVNGTERSEG